MEYTNRTNFGADGTSRFLVEHGLRHADGHKLMTKSYTDAIDHPTLAR